MTTPKPDADFISIAEFARRSSLCRGTLFNMVKRGDLPPPVQISPGRKAFPIEVYESWRARVRPGASAPPAAQ